MSKTQITFSGDGKHNQAITSLREAPCYYKEKFKNA
jgi:hypothetical protein